MITFQARYPGRCVCGDRITPGEQVQYDEDGDLCHTTCVDLAVTADRGDVCQQCFTIHAGECL